MFNPAVTDGVELFVYIVVGLISFAAALTMIDVKNTKSDQNDWLYLVPFVRTDFVIWQYDGTDYRQYKQKDYQK